MRGIWAVYGGETVSLKRRYHIGKRGSMIRGVGIEEISETGQPIEKSSTWYLCNDYPGTGGIGWTFSYDFKGYSVTKCAGYGYNIGMQLHIRGEQQY